MKAQLIEETMVVLLVLIQETFYRRLGLRRRTCMVNNTLLGQSDSRSGRHGLRIRSGRQSYAPV
jgi:hypothetical protein